MKKMSGGDHSNSQNEADQIMLDAANEFKELVHEMKNDYKEIKKEITKRKKSKS